VRAVLKCRDNKNNHSNLVNLLVVKLLPLKRLCMAASWNMLRTWKECELGNTFTIDDNEQGNCGYGVYVLVIKFWENVCWKVHKK
jgi:hypothetical protein